MKIQNFTGIVDNFNSDLWGHHVLVPMDVSAYIISKKVKRLICTINKNETFQCALMPKGDGRYFINLNKERRNRLKLREGEQVSVVLKEDDSKYGLPMPPEMDELMHLDPEGHQYFHSLTAGKQRSLLYIIGKPKKSETRLHKAWVVLEYLKSTRGRLDFKELNQAFKEHRELPF